MRLDQDVLDWAVVRLNDPDHAGADQGTDEQMNWHTLATALSNADVESAG